MKQSKTAILVFANSAEKEASLKPFLSSKELFKTLNSQVLHIVEKVGLPYVLISEDQQHGNSFGERFTNAILSVYNQGFEEVITIGNDTPHLTKQHILSAVERLQKNDIVLGPSADGGFYLMGLKKTHFNVRTFLKLPWQTSRLQQKIVQLIQFQNIDVSYLERLTDIDSVADAKTVIHSFRSLSKFIKQLLLPLVSKEISDDHTAPFHILNLCLTTNFNKGSPQLV